MNYIQMYGGLGNQLFEYAFGLLFKEVKYDVSWFIQNSKTKQDTVRKFELNCFNIDLTDKLVLVKEIRNAVYEECNAKYQPDLLKLENSYIFGYFQSYMYPKDNAEYLRNCCTLKNPPKDLLYNSLLDDIRNSNSISVHIRRSDYLKYPNIYRILDEDYYKEASKIIESKVSNPKYFIFSEDKDWCNQNLDFLTNKVIVDTDIYNRTELDMMLMKECKHNIIANSTYSWWSAFLNVNKDKLIIAPERWFNHSDYSGDRLFPDWISL